MWERERECVDKKYLFNILFLLFYFQNETWNDGGENQCVYNWFWFNEKYGFSHLFG